MFGMHYQRRDDEVAGRGHNPPASRQGFAQALLAQVLNRALPLELAFRRVYEMDDKVERQEALELLAGVVETFLEDIEEARTRGLRARLFAPTDTGTLTADCVPTADLAHLGGELVSVARAVSES
jgi:hypothetical protein